MGLLSKLVPSKPNLSTKPITIYRAMIRTDEGTHPFVYLVDPNADRPVVLVNPVGFQMPLNPMFMQTGKLTTEFRGELVPVKEIEPVDTESWPGDNQIRVEIPKDFRGKWIPQVERAPSELKTLTE